MEIKKDILWRVYLCFLFIVALSVAVIARAFFIQRVEGKFWRAEGDVTLAKNVRLHGEYNFDVKTKGTDTDYDDVASVSLNYVF